MKYIIIYVLLDSTFFVNLKFDILEVQYIRFQHYFLMRTPCTFLYFLSVTIYSYFVISTDTDLLGRYIVLYVLYYTFYTLRFTHIL